MLKISIGDVLDRLSICKLKSERTDMDCSKEINMLQQEVSNYPDTSSYLERLYQINGEIWNLESDIRKEKEATLGLEEVGRRAIRIRQFNNQRVSIKNEINSKFNEGFIETKINHGSQPSIEAVVSLSTVPERLVHDSDDGLKLVLQSLCEQTFKNYEVHFNVPHMYKPTGAPYNLPDWLPAYQLMYPHLKVFRTEDYGPPTKLLPTLHRITNPDTVIIIIDDDLVYHEELVQEHINHHKNIPGGVFGYDGRTNCNAQQHGDLRDSWVVCVTVPTCTHMVQHYKSVSYKRNYFEQDFFDDFVGKTRSDDVLVSYYFRTKKRPLIIMPYEKDNHLYDTFEKWNTNQGVVAFPVVRYANSPMNTGCNNETFLQQEQRFFVPPIFNEWLVKALSS